MRSLRWRAVDLRKRGWSYNIIAARLGVNKSTLSHWLRTVPYEPNEAVIRRIRRGPAVAAASKQRKRLEQIRTLQHQARRELQRVSRRDLLMLGLALYMGEGSRLYENIRFINSDQRFVRIAMQWFRKVWGVPERNFAIRVHLYPDSSHRASIAYWSRVTGVPRGQFEGVSVDRRLGKSPLKQRRLPYGTAHVKVRSRGDPRFGVELHRRICAWIDAVGECFAGVV